MENEKKRSQQGGAAKEGPGNETGTDGLKWKKKEKAFHYEGALALSSLKASESCTKKVNLL